MCIIKIAKAAGIGLLVMVTEVALLALSIAIIAGIVWVAQNHPW